LSIYLDASVVVSMFTVDGHTGRARRLPADEILILSDLTAAEFASAVAIHRRSGRMTEVVARTLFAQFDRWCALVPQRVEILSSDLRTAEFWIRLLEHPIRTADAAHIAVARRLGASLATFDNAMLEAAAAFGVETAAL
jgi:predicted nucleic acid-binding protein